MHHSPLALSNTAGDLPSGQYDPRNTRITCEDNANKITVYATDGSTRIYHFKKRMRDSFHLYLLSKEILPNGKVIKYYYNAATELISIESLDPKERYVYASIQMTGSPRCGHAHFISSSGLTVDYNYKINLIYWKIKENSKHGKSRQEMRQPCPPRLSSVSSPFYQNEVLNYCDKQLLVFNESRSETFTVINASFGAEDPHYRVAQILLPVGPNDTPLPVSHLNYQPPIAGKQEGKTTVQNSDGTSLTYFFSKNLLTTAIHFFDQTGILKKQKLFTWSENNWLKSVEIQDGQNHIFYKKSYEYDLLGNPILETFIGDLSGNGNPETYTTTRLFSDEGKHLLLQEENEEGKVICFSYLPDTNLITAKLTKEYDKILYREFFLYDDSNHLIEKITDDGTGQHPEDLSNVTQRTKITHSLRQTAPFLHMPEWTQETYLDKGVEKLFRKSHFVYDQHGNVAQEEVYDANENHAYTICKTYNERGDLLSETNRLGDTALYTYDHKGHPETTVNFSHRMQKTFRYDLKGRLRKSIETGDDGVVHVTSSDYDPFDRKIHSKDSYDNSTTHIYDPIVNQITQTTFPVIASVDHEPKEVITSATYDPFGRKLTQTDRNGNLTLYRYNTYGSPTEILYPNGAKEIFRYATNGNLIFHVNQDGLTTRYKNDLFGRVLSKTYLSKEGEWIAEETFTYNSFNTLTETDKQGHVTNYFYDGMGRKKRAEFCGHITDFSYDSLGRLATVSKHNDDNTLFTHYTRDLDGQILEEQKTDISGTILYRISRSYDKEGNQTTLTRYINGKEAIDAFTYDAFSRCTQHMDPDGHITWTTYNENCTNDLSQRVLQKITTDPKNITQIETQDALSRTICKETLNQEATLSSQEWFYDSQGNLLFQKDHIHENGHFKDTQTTKYTRTPDHQIEHHTRAFGTVDERTTSYTHFPSGKIATKTLPSGVTLTYQYHPFGQIERLDSSDGQIHHAFKSTLVGNLKWASDENQKIAIERELDPFGNVLQETFPSGLRVKKTYDNFNRSTTKEKSIILMTLFFYAKSQGSLCKDRFSTNIPMKTMIKTANCSVKI